LLVALSSYLILNTINPQLVSKDIPLHNVEVGVEKTFIDESTFIRITGQKLKTKSEYIPIVEKIALEEKVDSCMVKATIQVESNWKAGAIGCDEDVRSNDVPSRRAFIQSKIKYDGTVFSTSDISAKEFNNACKFDSKKPGFGLDWRFSKGGGLTQVTLFPSGYDTAAWYAGVKNGNSYWINRMTPYQGWEKLITPEENIRKGTQRLKEALKACNGSVEGAFRHYQTGKCSGSGITVNATVAKKLALYKDCK
jgi:hypothetical protein